MLQRSLREAPAVYQTKRSIKVPAVSEATVAGVVRSTHHGESSPCRCWRFCCPQTGTLAFGDPHSEVSYAPLTQPRMLTADEHDFWLCFTSDLTASLCISRRYGYVYLSCRTPPEEPAEGGSGACARSIQEITCPHTSGGILGKICVIDDWPGVALLLCRIMGQR